MPHKADFKKDLDAYQAPRGTFRIVDVPDLQYLMIDGHGDPNTEPSYAHAVQALFPLAYTVKFASKRELGRDYVVMPLEGLWWAEEMDAFSTSRDTSRWDWTLMIMVPDWIAPDLFDAAVKHLESKKRPDRLGDVRLQSLPEGLCVQSLHVGSYDDEAGVLRQPVQARSGTD